ncbi:DUF3159 domain-containing protein [Nocardiopsis sp. NPDC058631]|uniref:DUF3159 domain-containing protein n=1 Tax=Nocardiopsis sp. NPDC058631 TaxID=3346566 RepID=UPI003665E175
MTTTEPVRTADHSDDSDERAPGTEQPVSTKQAVLDQLGGTSGMIYTTLPVVVFAAAVPFTTLTVAIVGAIAIAAVLTAFRMWRGEPFMAALGGVFGVAAAGGLAAWTGSANDFFLIGIWASLVGAVITLASLLVRRPLTGVIWNAFHGGTHPWRQDKPSLRIHDLATLAVTAVLAGRFIVRQWLYLADSTTGLAIADTLTGIPLTALAAVVVIWAFRRSTKRLVEDTDTKDTAQE